MMPLINREKTIMFQPLTAAAAALADKVHTNGNPDIDKDYTVMLGYGDMDAKEIEGAAATLQTLGIIAPGTRIAFDIDTGDSLVVLKGDDAKRMANWIASVRHEVEPFPNTVPLSQEPARSATAQAFDDSVSGKAAPAKPKNGLAKLLAFRNNR